MNGEILDTVKSIISFECIRETIWIETDDDDQYEEKNHYSVLKNGTEIGTGDTFLEAIQCLGIDKERY